MSNNKKLMGRLRNKWWQNRLGIIGMLAVLALSSGSS
jgi:manganese transport protein